MRKLLFLFLWLCPLLAGAAHQPAAWQLFYKQSFAARNLYSSPLTVGGFRGATYDYKVIIYARPVSALAVISARFNGDSGSNYRDYSLYANNSSIYTTYSSTSTGMDLTVVGAANANHPSVFVGEITGKSGAERAFSAPAHSTYGDGPYSLTGCFWWKNTADELTSLTFFSAQNVAQTFDLIILQKPKLAQDAEWELVERKTLSATNLSNGVWFSGLDGDRDEEYLLKGCFTASASADVWACLNSDNGSNYTLEYLRNNAGTAAALNTTTGTGLYLGSSTATATHPLEFEALLQSKSGAYRQAVVTAGGGTATYSGNGVFYGWWRNSADVIENIKISCAATATGYIELYRRGKSVSASKPTFETLKVVDVDGEFSQGHTFDLAGLGISDADTETMFVLEWQGVTKTASQANMYITAILNGDTGNNYVYQHMYASNATTAASAGTYTALAQTGTDDTYPCFERLTIFPKSGKYRPVFEEWGTKSGTPYLVGSTARWWLNTADKLRSIKVYATSANQTQFKGKITLKRLVAQ